jgi:hypothetical protein
VDVLDLDTQQVLCFPSLGEAGKHFQVNSGHILQAISRDENKRLFKKRYLIVLHGEPFPTLNQEELEELLRPGGKEVVAFDVGRQFWCIYPSASQFIKEWGLSKKGVTVDLRKNLLRNRNGWWYTYNTPENVTRIKAAVRSSSQPSPV